MSQALEEPPDRDGSIAAEPSVLELPLSEQSTPPASPTRDGASGRQSAPPRTSRWERFRARLRQPGGLWTALERLVELAALVVGLVAVAYVIFPFSTQATFVAPAQSCSPAVVQVFHRGPVQATTNKHLTPPCTQSADHRLYEAVPAIVIDLIALAGLKKILRRQAVVRR
ncbi:MAG: hypothetical protein ACRD0I_10585 [Acidimicrobiales bacterium]